MPVGRSGTVVLLGSVVEICGIGLAVVCVGKKVSVGDAAAA